MKCIIHTQAHYLDLPRHAVPFSSQVPHVIEIIITHAEPGRIGAQSHASECPYWLLTQVRNRYAGARWNEGRIRDGSSIIYLNIIRVGLLSFGPNFLNAHGKRSDSFLRQKPLQQQKKSKKATWKHKNSVMFGTVVPGQGETRGIIIEGSCIFFFKIGIILLSFGPHFPRNKRVLGALIFHKKRHSIIDRNAPSKFANNNWTSRPIFR